MVNFTWFFKLFYEKMAEIFGFSKEFWHKNKQQKHFLVQCVWHVWGIYDGKIFCTYMEKWPKYGVWENPQIFVMIIENSILGHNLTLNQAFVRIVQVFFKSIFTENPIEFHFFSTSISYTIGSRNTQQCSKKKFIQIFHFEFSYFYNTFYDFLSP